MKGFEFMDKYSSDKINKYYDKRITRFNNVKSSRKQLSSFYSVFRLLFFILSLFLFIYSYKIANYKLTLGIIVFFSIGFLFLTQKHNMVKAKISKINSLIALNYAGKKRYNNDYKDFDNGNDLIDENHNFANDLDILGNGSLYQKISSSITPLGRIRLKDELYGNMDFSINEIEERQVSIEELSSKTFFCQRFIAEGLVEENKFDNPEELINWGSDLKGSLLKPYTKILINAMTLLTIVALLVPLFFSNINYTLGKLCILINIILLLFDSKKRNDTLNKVFKYKNDINSYANMISYFEKTKFMSTYLITLQNSLKTKNGSTLTKEIENLNKIAHKISDRRNIFYVPLNILLLWDYRVYHELECFRKNSGSNIINMIHAISQVEALISLSNINRDNPNWALPTLTSDNLIIQGKGLAHPLLNHKAICNDVTLDKNSKILLITGSNMSGKSTLLRTVGLNLVLAYVGTKVRAENLVSSKMKLFTCMRTKDNLEENISSFYAEILRIKALINLCNENENIFFLLDEIFKGTNSIDRHMGAEILINQLSKYSTLGFVSTHDLELGGLYNEVSNIKNFHFKEYYKNNEIFFDYKLRPGVSTTRNALFLMKMAGIDINE
jgi:DNA mismatch repair ATPase MutS